MTLSKLVETEKLRKIQQEMKTAVLATETALIAKKTAYETYETAKENRLTQVI